MDIHPAGRIACAAVMAGTGPAIAPISGGGYEVGFQGATPVATTVATTPVSTPVPQPPADGPSSSSASHELKVMISLKWTWRYRHTRLRRFRLGPRPAKTEIGVSCRGRGCGVRHAHASGRHVRRLVRRLQGSRFRAGDVVLIAVRAPGYSAERVRVLIRDSMPPAVKLL